MSITLKTIPQIKAEIGIPKLNLSRQTDTAGDATAWLSHWDNDKRIRVVIHENTLALAKESGNNPVFFFKSSAEFTKEGPSAGVMYTKIMLCSANIETTL